MNANDPGCRPGCGACCIIPSISSPIPGMPAGKPAFGPCIHLRADYGCRIFDADDRPRVCASLRPSAEMCGDDRDQALVGLTELENFTAPAPHPG